METQNGYLKEIKEHVEVLNKELGDIKIGMTEIKTDVG